MKFQLGPVLLFCFLAFASDVALAQPGFDESEMQSILLAQKMKENPNDTSLIIQNALLTKSTPLLLEVIKFDKKHNGAIYFQLAENEWNTRRLENINTYLDSAFAHGHGNLEWFRLKSYVLKEENSPNQRTFTDECISIFPREAGFRFDKAYLLLKEDSLLQADAVFRDALLYNRESALFPITYWVEAIYKKDEKLAKEWIDQMNASVRSMSDVSNAHFYSGYYY
jgi:hypothetical protein